MLSFGQFSLQQNILKKKHLSFLKIAKSHFFFFQSHITFSHLLSIFLKTGVSNCTITICELKNTSKRIVGKKKPSEYLCMWTPYTLFGQRQNLPATTGQIKATRCCQKAFLPGFGTALTQAGRGNNRGLCLMNRPVAPERWYLHYLPRGQGRLINKRTRWIREAIKPP